MQPPKLWFPLSTPLAHPVLRMFCFPFAGGGASVFHRWADELPGGVEVCGVQLPGHETRIAEPALSSAGDAAAAAAGAIEPLLDLPYLLFGHSMGALIAFETARLLRARGAPAPRKLLVSARIAPHIPDEEARPLAGADDATLIAEVKRLQFTDSAVFEHEELLELALPALRADFSICANYVYGQEAPLAAPITAFAGLHDREVPVEQVEAWKGHTSGPFALKVIDGDHFFIKRERAQLLAALRGEVLAVL